MSESTITKNTFKLLRELSKNNNREWYAEHKSEFKQQVQEPFAALLETITAKLKRSANPLRGSKKTMFRIHRDVRFSKDKRPYKENVAGLLTPSGTKDESEGLIYVHLEKDGGFIATGCYMTPTPVLNQVRDMMINETKNFQTAVRRAEKSGFQFDEGNPVKTMPRGYADHTDHPLASFIRMRNIIVSDKITKDHWIDGSVVQRVTELNRAALPLNDFVFAAMR
ncbi:MAG: DUF2461 domain-containing protein [Planctomycetota bacterium]